MAMRYLFLALALVLNATANVLLKIGAARLGSLDEPNLAGRLITNYHLLAGLSLFALNVVFYILALARLNLWSWSVKKNCAPSFLVIRQIAASRVVSRSRCARIAGVMILGMGVARLEGWRGKGDVRRVRRSPSVIPSLANTLLMSRLSTAKSVVPRIAVRV
jgi:hypothetical protein